MKDFHFYFVAVGPQRTGTSWLHQVLQHHPKLCLPRNVDEPMFFDRYYDQGLSRYMAYFSHRKEDQQCGDISPTYFDTEIVPDRIHQMNPDCKIIINLRDPINRATSLYRHHLSKGRVSGSFAEAVAQMPRIISSGSYAKHIPRWLDRFGSDHVTFVLLDDIKLNPEAVFTHICSFLNIPSLPIPARGYDKINPITMPRYPWLAKINAQIVTWLQTQNLYTIVKLGKQLGLRKFIYEGGSNNIPKPNANELMWLAEQYEADIVYLESLLKRNLQAWRCNPNEPVTSGPPA